MAIQNLSSQAISASYQNLMQVSSSGQLYNGTGSLIIRVAANSFTGSFTGSLFGTASNAQTASFVNTLNQNVVITGSLRVSGSITGSLQGTSTLIPIASSSISAGSIFFDTVTNKLYVHNGTSWKTASLG